MISNIRVLLDDLINSITKYENELTDQQKHIFAKAFCQNVIIKFWKLKVNSNIYPIKQFDNTLEKSLEEQPNMISSDISNLLAETKNEEAGYIIGNIYTSLLPKKYRSKIGAYYTPPILVNRLLNKLDNYGVDWKNDKILDPSCGGAAFLTIISRFIINKCKDLNHNAIFEIINNNLFGYEIDPFAAWISQTLLELETYDLFLETNKRISKKIDIKDSLESDYTQKFDVIIGNPPYGKISINQELRNKFSKSVYGHANLYSLFTDLAYNLVNDNGYIAYVTPTSFLGGNYFKKLRELMGNNSPLISIDFIKDRSGVFADVLQETALTIYKKSKFSNQLDISQVSTNKNLDIIDINSIGSLSLSLNTEKPWFIPRDKNQIDLLQNLSHQSYNLSDYGYKVKTGQLVWNRLKNQLSDSNNNAYPLIWAESILNNGVFEFKYSKKNHSPYFKLKENQDYLLTRNESLIMQRTTSKEQNRRIITAIIPQKFINKYNGVVIENHVNIITSEKETILDLKTLNVLLNSITIDKIFRCINGSVAVSAYEINSLPLPSPNQIEAIKAFISNNNNLNDIENYISKIYGEEIDQSDTTGARYNRKIG